MPLARLRALGLELKLFTSDEMFSADLTVKNGLWSSLYRGLTSIIRGLKSKPVPLTEPVAERPTVEFHGASNIKVWADAPDDAKELARRCSEHKWYHTYDLGNGIITPGAFDHTPIIERYQLPDSLAGKRVLDVACFDGFWAFEFERRGAQDVVALDLERARELDLPFAARQKMTEEQLDRRMGKGFKIVHEAKNSKVNRVHCNVYDLSPETAGIFDLVHIGDVLVHLQNPMKALDRVRQVTRGEALISDVFDPRLDRLGRYPLFEYCGGQSDCYWWNFSLEGMERMIQDAGFSKVELLTTFRYGMRGQLEQMWHAIFRASV